MFNKKNDPLVESVKAVMKQNEVHRQAEAALNEELGISSKKALPHEYHAQYDALLEAKVFHAEKKLAGQRVRNIVGAAADKTVKKIKGALSNKSKPTDRYKEMVKREIPEETDYSSKQKKLAMLGNVSGHGGDPEKIDGPDLSAARKGHAHKVGLEEKKLTSAETSKKEELVKKMKKGDWSKRYGKRGREVMYATATKMAEKLAEAEGDVNPSEMTPISKGLQDRIVKDPPKPKPETKQMNEASYGGKLVAAIRKQREMSADPDVDLKPKPANLSLGAREMVKRGAKLSMAESVIAEIRENLEANLIAIHESGDDELFENYILSLTEEELDILGLNEAGTTQAGQTPLQRAQAQAATPPSKVTSKVTSRGNPTGGTTAPAAAAPAAARPAPAVKTTPTASSTEQKFDDGSSFDNSGGSAAVRDTQGNYTVQSKTNSVSGSPGRGVTTLPPKPATGTQSFSAPPASNQADDKARRAASSAAAGSASGAPGSTGDFGAVSASPAPKPATSSPAAAATSASATPAAAPKPSARPATSAARPSAEPNIHMQAFGATAVSGDSARGPQVYRENVQIKESLESFLRNRFLKG